jgi:adenylate kinase family enzyme
MLNCGNGARITASLWRLSYGDWSTASSRNIKSHLANEGSGTGNLGLLDPSAGTSGSGDPVAAGDGAAGYGEPVAMLGPVDPLPCRPYRVLVAGTSGAGKTTTAARIAGVLGIPHVEIDALFHGSDWTPRPSFESDVHAFSAGPAWATEWQYSAVRAHLAACADLLVWLDLPRSLVMRQVIRRTLVRRLRRQQLWNGNREPALWTIFTDREHIVRWAWNTNHKGRRGLPS